MSECAWEIDGTARVVDKHLCDAQTLLFWSVVYCQCTCIADAPLYLYIFIAIVYAANAWLFLNYCNYYVWTSGWFWQSRFREVSKFSSCERLWMYGKTRRSAVYSHVLVSVEMKALVMHSLNRSVFVVNVLLWSVNWCVFPQVALDRRTAKRRHHNLNHILVQGEWVTTHPVHTKHLSSGSCRCTSS